MRVGMMVRGALVVAAASASVAMAATPAEIVAARQNGFKQIGKANKAIMDTVRSPAPAVPTIRASAKILAAHAARLPSWFPKGTGPESGVKTAALPVIWSNPAGFRKQAQAFQVATRQLNAAAASGKVAQIKAAVPKVAGTCKSCHEGFRGRK